MNLKGNNTAERHLNNVLMWRFASRSLRLCLFADDGTPLRGLLIAQSRGVRLSVHPKVTNFIALQKAKSTSAY